MTPAQRTAQIDRVLAGFRARLIRLEMQAMVNAGKPVSAIQRRIQKLIEQAMRAPGFTPDARYLSNTRVVEALMVQAREYGDTYATAAVREIQAAQAGIILDAQRTQATALLLQTAPGIAPRIAGQLRAVGTDRIASLVGIARPDSPVWSLKSLGKESTDLVMRGMIRGAARGDSPRMVARAVSKQLADDADWKVLRVTRTEMLRASRESSRAFAAVNERVVAGWAWHAQLDAGTCASCWAMHGTLFPTEVPLSSHPNCRCALVVQPRLPSELGFEGVDDLVLQIPSGADEFAKLDTGTQRKILGPLKHEAYADGRISLGDVVAKRTSAEWGDTRSVASLSQALKNAG